MTSWIWTCSSHMSTTAGACAQTAWLGLQQCCICVLTLFSTLWWLTDCCMLYSPENPWSMQHFFTMCHYHHLLLKRLSSLQYVVNSISHHKDVDSLVCGLLGEAYGHDTFQWLNLSSCLSWDQLQTESGLKCTDFLSVWVFRSVCEVLEMELD